MFHTYKKSQFIQLSLSVMVALEFSSAATPLPPMIQTSVSTPIPREEIITPAKPEDVLMPAQPSPTINKEGASPATSLLAPYKNKDTAAAAQKRNPQKYDTKIINKRSLMRMATVDEGDTAPAPSHLAETDGTTPARITKTVTVTAYSSTSDQTDASPCSTANGFDVCKQGVENVVAVNGLPFGTKLRFPEMFGDRIFTVQDRMNARYTDRMDVWMKSRGAAMQFGVKHLKVEIL